MSQQTSQHRATVEGQASSDQAKQFLTFVLNDEIYGIGILNIREIIEYADLTVVPLMPDFISGVINLRGKVVPVVNLARRFGHDPKDIGKRTSIVIIDVSDSDSEDDNIEVGIVVDIVNEVIELAAADIAAPPTFGTTIRADFIEGMGKIDDKLMILLDVNHVLSIKELSTISEISEDLNTSSTDQVSNG